MIGWIIFLIFIIIFKIYQKVTCGICLSDAELNGKVIIVTGANCGIGYETAKDLASRGARVILACRNDDRGIKARDSIIQETGNKDVVYKNLDLSSLDSVRKFAEDFISSERRLDILINNAGAAALGQKFTKDGIPIEIQINHFGPFLLTNLLLPMLIASAPSRIIIVSSNAHHFGSTDLKRLNTKWDNNIKVYCNSKLCNVLFANELSRRLEGTGVVANSLHPGVCCSKIYRNGDILTRTFSFLYNNLLFKNEWEGAQTSIHLAVSKECEKVTGKHFVDCKPGWMNSKAKDPERMRKLWEISEELVNLYHSNKVE